MIYRANSTGFVTLDRARAEIRAQRMVGNTEQLRVKHPDMPGVRWMQPTSNGNGHYSRYVDRGLARTATCFFLPKA